MRVFSRVVVSEEGRDRGSAWGLARPGVLGDAESRGTLIDFGTSPIIRSSSVLHFYENDFDLFSRRAGSVLQCGEGGSRRGLGHHGGAQGEKGQEAQG